MIVYLKKKEIDLEKYDACVGKAHNSRIYAYSWYLDCVADHWDVLVLGDYEAVMPLPWRSKFFIKYIYPPCWTQQLGVFGSEFISEELMQDFIKAIPNKFKKVTLQYNSRNPILKGASVRRNYILKLDRTLSEMHKGFNKNRKRFLKKESEALFEKKVLPEEFLRFYKIHGHSAVFSKNHWRALQKLLNSGQQCVHIWGMREKGMLSAAMVWVKDDKRLTYLLPCVTSSAKKKGMPSFLVFELIRAHANTDLCLDFEGSMIPGVARFYKSFGAQKELYSFYQRKLFF